MSGEITMQAHFKIQVLEPLQRYYFKCPNCLVMFPATTPHYSVIRIEDHIGYSVCKNCIDSFAKADLSEQAALFERYIAAIGDGLDD